MPAEPEADVMAGELALGVLDGAERAAALRRVIAEPAFAREVEEWRAQFGSMFAEWPDEAAPGHLLGRIEQSLEPAKRSAGYWPAVAAVLTLVAASLLLVIVLRPAVTPPGGLPSGVPGANMLVASLEPAGKGAALPAVYDPAKGELRILAAAGVPAGRAGELWMIGQDGVPRSLGLLGTGRRNVVRIALADRTKLTAGLKLAISNEPRGGSPTGLPTGPIVASGELISS
jgi:anti-sigma-K factor RskA